MTLEENRPDTVAVEAFFHGPTSTWTYVVSDPATAVAAVIDPVLDFDAGRNRISTRSIEQIVEYVRRSGLQVDWILETHAHADHLTGAELLRQRVGGTIAIGEGIREVQASCLRHYDMGGPLDCDGRQFGRLLRDGETLVLGSIAGKVIATPGHTADGIAYLIEDALFVGDTLLMPDVGTGRCDFPGGDAAALYRSIRRLYELPADTRVHVGHDYPPGNPGARGPGSKREPAFATTISHESRDNVMLCALTAEDDFVRRRNERDGRLAPPALLHAALRVNLRAGRTTH